MASWSVGTGWSIVGGSGAGRGYTAGWFALELDNIGVPVGYVTQMDGGTFNSDVATDQNGNDQYVRKYASRPKYGDINIGIGMPNSMQLFGWVASTLQNNPQRHSGALIGFDNFSNRKERSRRTFSNALLSEITFPTLDASSNAAANIQLKIAPESLTYAAGFSTFNAQQARDEDIKQKRWSCSNFGFRLDGFWGVGAQRNVRIDSFTVRHPTMENASGDRLESTKEPGRVEYPNLSITFGEQNMANWYSWYQQSVVGGVVSRRTGAISWYAPDRVTELMRLELDGVGLLNLEIDRYQAGQEKIAVAKATLFVETMTLVPGAGNI
jgi:phage tail-like protein